MSRNIKLVFSLSYVFLLIAACDKSTIHKQETKAEAIAEQFCLSYFSLHYADAQPFCTEESEKWLRFAASNVHEEDLSALHSSDARVSVSVLEVSAREGDSIGSALVRVRNYLSLDRLDAPAQIVDEGVFRIGMVRRGGRWFVKMEGLPRSEKRNRD